MRRLRAAPVMALALLAASAACAPAAPPTAVGSLLTPLPPLIAATTPPAAAPPPTGTPLPTLTATAPVSLPSAPATPATATRRAGGPRATITPSPTPTAGCVNDAEYLTDLTVPDGAQFLPGQDLSKAWSVRNSGTCDWGPGYRLVFLDGTPLTTLTDGRAQTEFALYPARAGSPAVWEIPMRAPDTPGAYLGRWQARDPAGQFFGGVVYVKLEVIALPATATPAP